MLYFSELQNNRVLTKDGIYIGKLKDVIFRASDNPVVTKLVVKTDKNPEAIIPIEDVRKINGGVILEKSYVLSKLKENELFLTKNLLDNQIIDISGDKIVRVNDVAIQDKPGYSIAGVDIGLVGILRWLGLIDFINKLLGKIGIKLRSQFLSWADIQTLELSRGHVKIKKEQTKLEKIRPEDLADYLEETNVANVKGILRVLGEKKSVEVINNLRLNYQTALFKQFESDQAAKILTTEFISVQPDQTVKEVIDTIRKETNDFYNLSYVYVVNKDMQLVGVFDLHELLMQGSNTQVYKFMTQRLVTIQLTTPMVVAFRKIVKYKLYALPVVDREKRMLGIVIYDDIVDLHLRGNE